MKKLAILAVAVLGTFSMVNAQTTPAQTTQTKEAKAPKYDKKTNKKAKGEKKAETAKPEAEKAK
ncbi:hypothetical protein [Flavobacterium ginsenosidimutans]|uniref:Uncharacterized protein n=1 Tax=Flavobacterium ginsenosidimutans TaxID=687844 RepID=A0ABZ2QA43_9FLAO|nr:hypothetical protein [Flavobacterium ginsenosidimutans]KAF2329513.1 hypothetical protein DM444_14795 [Flavobacterium ginsenosidimutans]